MYHRHAVVATRIGDLTLVAADAALIGIYFPQHWVKPERATLGDEVALESDPLLSEVARQLNEYLAGERTVFEIPTAADGDAFQERVWALLRQIPFGETTTYGELAERSATNRWRGWSAGRSATIRCPSSCRATGWSARTAS